MHSKKNDKFVTQFFDKDDNELDPNEIMGKHCHTEAAIKIELYLSVQEFPSG